MLPPPPPSSPLPPPPLPLLLLLLLLLPYVQDMRQCDYSSFITLAGPEEIRAALVDAAQQDRLCEALPKWVPAFAVDCMLP
jgi:hypothetical protein